MATETYDDHSTLTTVATDDKIVMWDTSGSIPYGITVANFKTSALGSGTLLADGSVPMTGSLDLAATGIISTDGDSSHDFGRATVGYDGATTDVAIFAHRDNATSTNYAVAQSAIGNVALNVPTSGTIFFTVNNSTKMSMTASALNLFAFPITSNDADTVYTLGRATLGYDGATADVAIFAHRDMATAANFALSQTALGDTVINAASTKTISFNIADTPEATLSATDLDVKSLTISSDDADTDYDFGRVTIGAITTDTAVFAHRDRYAAGTAAITQTAAGQTTISGAAGQTVNIAVNGVDLVEAAAADSFYPSGDNVLSLGKTGQRWTELWAVSATIQTSDEKEKYDIESSTLGFDFINSLKPVSYKWRNSEDTSKTYHGLTAQSVKSILEDKGIPDNSFAGYVEGETSGLRYTEFIAPIIKSIQELGDRLSALENKGV